MNQIEIFDTIPRTPAMQDKAISAPVEMTKRSCLFRDLTEAELAAALAADTPGAMSEESLRATLSRHPEIRREAVVPSWGERCAQSS